MNEWLLLVGGGLLLYFGAEWFVGGASALALALRVPQIIGGLTVVAFGTSASPGPVSAPLRTLALDLGALLGMTILAAIFIRTERTITRLEGAVALGLYVAFTAITIARG